MAMSWEETADSRLREIRRLRACLQRSTLDSFIIEQAAGFYSLSKKAFSDSRATKPEDAPLNEGEVKHRAEMDIVADFVAKLGVMSRAEFIGQAETFAETKEDSQ